jgi:hypothetical protein
MAEILGLRITHQPTLGREPIRPGSLLNTLRDPGLPEKYRTPDGWPERMRQEWGSDDGRAFAREHRDAVVSEIRKARQALDAFKPDFLVVWGDDQYENFREDLVPAFTVLAYDSVEAQPWQHDGKPIQNAWGEGPETTLRVRGHPGGARALASGLLEAEFDVAYAYRPLHEPLGHAFVNSLLYLDWDRRGLDVPVVPVAVNCYGRRLIALKGYMDSLANPVQESDFDPPSPSPRRCFDLGAATARILARSPWRVALVASSSWSHAFLTAKNYYLYPDTPADRTLYSALCAGDYAAWRSWTLADVEASGQQEMLNWFCLVGAMAELGRRPLDPVFIESNIMNSNKVIAIFD